MKNLLLREELNELCINAQVLNEFINITTKKIEYPLSFSRLHEVMNFLQIQFVIFPISKNTSQKAIILKQKYKYSFWDCLILSSALEENCSILYSEDMQHNQIIESSLKIINPFV